MMRQANGWDKVQQLSIDRLCHKIAVRRVALGALETLLNAVINNSVAEQMERMNRFHFVAEIEYKEAA